jgi:O-antigen ligase
MAEQTASIVSALAAPPVSSNRGRASAGTVDGKVDRELDLAALTVGPLVVAAAIPLVFLHVRYQPTVSFNAGGTSVDIRLSDLAVLAVALTAAVTAMRAGWRPLRRGVPVWTGGGAFLLLALVSISYPLLRDQSYDWHARLVSGLKLCEYATLALAVPLVLRTRPTAIWPLRAVIAWSAVATGWGVLQFAGAVNEFEGKRPGQREPSFVGIHDLAALSGAALVLWLVSVSLRDDDLVGRRWALGGALTGAIGIVLSGSMVAVVGLWLAAACIVLVARWRGSLRRRTVGAVAAVVLIVTAGTVLMRGSTLEAFASFLGVKHEKTTGVQSYAHRTLLAYIGLRIWLDQPVTGVGFQGTYDQFAYGPQLAAAHRRFPDEPEQAFPSPAPDRQWGVQNLYIDTLACLGVIGMALLLAFFGAAMAIGIRGAATSSLALVGVGWLLLAAGVWNGIGLVAGIPLVALTWLGAGLATSRV